ncbi:condensation domain-containing protein [Micromonospora sp. WMMD1102]|uniref:condensation domain-containing protein n=1 Tax=Micromonospora sp. WMMD1102 TaxID=3016105 RepID=UPI002415486C|nr:condensation domain-containing protein [Micromonospora sp. WMMD1102]MDG4786439.1 condensation domain-containing protein [Micromonospora sp. WMMD1102]
MSTDLAPAGGQPATPGGQPVVEPSPGAGHPLSVGQEALWFLYQLAPESPAYNITLAVRVRTALDDAALARAVDALVARHPVLGTAFAERDGAPRQYVPAAPPAASPAGAAASRWLEIRDVPGRTDAALLGLARSVGEQPFRLGAGEVFRVVLLRRAAADAALVLVTHHIVSDATSQWLLLRDLLAGYRGIAAGGAPDWAPLTAGYLDHVEAERKLLDSPRRARLERYWRERCTGVSAGVIPLDRPRPERQTFDGATHHLRLPDELAGRVRSAASAAGVTPFAFLLGVFQATLYRYGGQDDFTLGCPVATRYGAGLRDVVGYLVNTVVLRSSFAPGATFAAAVASAHRELLSGLAHVGYPFPLLDRMLGAARGGSRAPLFRIAFTMVAADRLDPPLPLVPEGAVVGPEIEHSGLRLAAFDVPQLEGQFDLNVELRQSEDSLAGAFRYNTDLFDDATIERLTGHYRRLLEAATADPTHRIDRVSLVDSAQLELLLALGTGGVSPGR